jgi:hypothetical protein
VTSSRNQNTLQPPSAGHSIQLALGGSPSGISIAWIAQGRPVAQPELQPGQRPVELPTVKSIQIHQQLDQDAATCTIEL